MNFSSDSFADNKPIPEEFAYAKLDPVIRTRPSGNRNPALSWSDVPEDCKTLALICADPDAPKSAFDVNKDGRTVKANVPRGDFHHWVMVDIPPTCTAIAAGECSDGVTPRGKQSPPAPAGAPEARQGLNDFTKWFADDPELKGKYLGYDGPAPPWNDESVHHYKFTLYALDLERCPVEGEFTAKDVTKAIEGHVLAEKTLTGTYTLNPKPQPVGSARPG